MQFFYFLSLSFIKINFSMAIIIGNAHPIQNKMKGVQNYLAQFHATFFDGLYYLKSPAAAQKAAWKSSSLSYGIYTEANIPFLLLEFPKEKWSFLTPLNTVQGGSAWLSSADNVLNLFLLNADNNITESIRTLKVDSTFGNKLRETCKAQLTQYKTSNEVELAVAKIVQSKNFLQMKQAAYMVNVITI
jgi:hypothetical protein